MTEAEKAREFAPCPTCHQYSHSIGEDRIAEAFNHFQSMVAHPVRGHPMGHNFDETTRDAAQVLMAAAQPMSREDIARIIADARGIADPFITDIDLAAADQIIALGARR